jgi:hypothetical protein
MRHGAAFGLLACLVLPWPATAQTASVTDIVQECDVLAAHPSDPQRVSEGVADDRIVARLAIVACETAIKADAADPRHVFQLGRALLASGRKADATPQFQKAADRGYAAAWAYLGDAYQFGYGVPVDLEKARGAYIKSVQGGFQAASDLVDQMNFLPEQYTVTLVGQIYAGDHAAIGTLSRDTDRRWPTRAYLFSFVQKLMAECDTVIAAPTYLSLLTFRYAPAWVNDGEPPTAAGIYAAAGEHDAGTFTRRHGCEGVIAKHVFRSLDLFLAGFKE